MLSQDDYKLYTGETSTLSDEDWTKIVSMAAVRLAGLLCLEELPKDDKGNLPNDLQLVLANFICLMMSERGRNLRITSKKVRNFTINYGSESAANAFAKVSDTYPDIIAKYSQCDLGFAIEKSTPECSHYGRF